MFYVILFLSLIFAFVLLFFLWLFIWAFTMTEPLYSEPRTNEPQTAANLALRPANLKDLNSVAS
ncbi:MAG: hypothetical protein KC422_00060 [Trueperaceae bacterium]|nr:hypothetical protein [Trueperaceae bacterium]